MPLIYAFILTALAAHYALAIDWSTHLHDNNRSARTDETLVFPLHETWQFQSSKPRYAWDDPALQDFWQRAAGLKPRMIFDRAHYVVSADNKVFFGSTVDDQIYCLDAKTGEIVWRYYTLAPVRLPPALHDGKVYAGSDDGNVYCLDAVSGELIWKVAASPEKRLLPGNERIISPWAVRTGVLIDEGIAFFASGMFPEEKVYLCALKADTGNEVWKHEIPYSPQGFLLSSGEHLFVPTGGSTPLIFNIKTGEFIKQLQGSGGSYALLSDDQLFYGPGLTGQISSTSTLSQAQSQSQSPSRIATFSGNHMIVTPAASYLHTDTELSAIDRNQYLALIQEQKKLSQNKSLLERQLAQAKNETNPAALKDSEQELRAAQTALSENHKKLQQCILWNIPCAHPYSLILAGKHLLAGGENTVVAYEASTGKEVWRADINGKAYGLTVANQMLFVSTDTGAIHGFGIHPVDTVKQRASSQKISVQPVSIKSFSNNRKGYAVIAGWNPMEVEELIQHSQLHIVIVADNELAVEQARRWLQDRDVYGKRAVVLPGKIVEQGFTNYMANTVIMADLKDQRLQPSDITAAQIVVRPSGGTIYIDTDDLSDSPEFSAYFQFPFSKHRINMVNELNGTVRWIITRASLPNAGEWTHLYANAGNTASSGDQHISQNLHLQWFGRPGPRLMIDRHLRPPSPLAKDGRLFIPANDYIFAADAYNGTVLWQNQVPGFRRVGIPYDTGNMVVTNDFLYAVADQVCFGFSVATGEKLKTLQLPAVIQEKYPSHEWGYLAYSNGKIIGSAQSPEASRTEMNRDEIVEQYATFRPLVTSDALFLYDTEKNTHHVYEHGTIINTSIAANSSLVYFLECHAPELKSNTSGRSPLSQLFAGEVKLTALDLQTGETRFQEVADVKHLLHIVYLSCTENVIAVVGSYDNKETGSVWYSVTVFDAKTGKQIWQQRHENNIKGIGGDHGEQVHHPVILQDKIIAEPHAYELATGALILNNNEPWFLPGRNGCGTASGSANCLFYRNSNPMIFDFNTGVDPVPLSTVNRPGCWINMIPAGGLVLVPEASSGCTCNYSIQTSMAFIPSK